MTQVYAWPGSKWACGSSIHWGGTPVRINISWYTLYLRLLPWCWIISAILIGPGHANIVLDWCIVLTYIIILFIIWKLNSRHWRFTFLILKLKQPCPQIFISIFSKNSISIKTALEIVFKIMLLTEIVDLWTK